MSRAQDTSGRSKLGRLPPMATTDRSLLRTSACTMLFGWVESYGHVLGRDDIAIDQLSEEHGRLVSSGPIGLAVGDKVRIVPNYACVVTNLVDTLLLVGAGHKTPVPTRVVARGRTT